MGRPNSVICGVVNYQPEKCFNGYTLFQARNQGAALIDMNGKVVHMWKGLNGNPNRLLPGGEIISSRGERDNEFAYQDKIDLVQVDWDGNIKWIFNKNEYIEDPGFEPQWMARQHHDYQREGNPVGYYVPDMVSKTENGNTLILVHQNVRNNDISDKLLLDDCILEIDWEGNIVWKWCMSDHIREIGLNQLERSLLYTAPAMRGIQPEAVADWAHINCMSLLGPNKWYDNGDERFHPDNIILDSRILNTLMIVSKKTGKIVWKVGPDYSATRELRMLGMIIGPHHTHMIPKGLPGAGNILLFDNGGWAGYGLPNPTAVKGDTFYKRDYSRVLEFDPITLKIKWQFSPSEMDCKGPAFGHYFYSPLVSSAQRLPNGNTLITEGIGGRFLEVTEDCEIVWEYISPYSNGKMKNMVYRAYRYPYEWVPQLDVPQETPVKPIDSYSFRLAGAAGPEFENVSVSVEGTWSFEHGGAACVE